MTFTLVEMLKKEFPPFRGVECITIYGAYERIYLSLPDWCFKGAQQFEDHEAIKQIATEIFDVNFVYEKKGHIGPAIFFEPLIRDEYHQNHYGHFIQVHLPFIYPLLTISTANRGRGELLEKQRNNYFTFVKRVFDKFKEKAR